MLNSLSLVYQQYFAKNLSVNYAFFKTHSKTRFYPFESILSVRLKIIDTVLFFLVEYSWTSRSQQQHNNFSGKIQRVQSKFSCIVKLIFVLKYHFIFWYFLSLLFEKRNLTTVMQVSPEQVLFLFLFSFFSLICYRFISFLFVCGSWRTCLCICICKNAHVETDGRLWWSVVRWAQK